jgi:fermentation-respiration switch protein FrsA (DUF1100 family)
MELPTPRTATRSDSHEGLAYELWLPEAEPPWPGIVVLHGAGSSKESHADFARAASGSGMAAIAYDQRGHGDSEGEMSPDAVNDVARMARLLGSETGVDPTRIAVRGSSMGGYMAIQAAATSDSIAGAIAFCPAGEEHLLWGLRHDELEMKVDERAFEAWLEEHDLRDAVELMGPKPLILIHAQGDEQIPFAWSEELYQRAAEPRKLIVVPGGHHRSTQHDPELQSVALRWLQRELSAATR